jgi:hypothetical protein
VLLNDMRYFDDEDMDYARNWPTIERRMYKYRHIDGCGMTLNLCMTILVCVYVYKWAEKGQTEGDGYLFVYLTE